MKKGCSLLVALAMLMCAVFSGAVAEEDFDPVQLMHDVNGTYTELFTTLCKPEYDSVWVEKSAAVVGEENAEEKRKAELRDIAVSKSEEQFRSDYCKALIRL